MPNYQVKVMEVHYQVIEVKADSPEDALKVANKVIETGIQQDGSKLPYETEYSHTLEFDEWRVWEA